MEDLPLPAYHNNQPGLKGDCRSLPDKNNDLACIQKQSVVSHYLKFDLLKCKIITSKGSSLHQQFHIYDVAEESDLACLSAPAVREEKKHFASHSYQTFYFVKVYQYFLFPRNNFICQSNVLEMAQL